MRKKIRIHEAKKGTNASNEESEWSIEKEAIECKESKRSHTLH